MKFPDPPGGVDLLDQVIDVVGVQQPAARDQALRTALAHCPTELGRDDVARDSVQPRPWPAEGSSVARRRVDHGDEYLRGQVSDLVRVRHPAGHEPGYVVYVRAVELGERGGVGPDRPNRRLCPWVHRRSLR